MKLTEILKKVSDGKDLTDEEKDFLAQYDPTKEKDGFVPKSRLDSEIAKFKAQEKKTQELETNIATIQSQLDELSNKGLSEVEKNKKDMEKLQTQLADMTKKHDDANKKYSDMLFNNQVEQIAKKNNFTDSSYLSFLIKSKNIDIEKDDDVKNLVTELTTSSPNLFKSDAKSGSGGKPNNDGIESSKLRVDELLKKDTLTKSELSEIIEFQSKEQTQ